MSKLTIPAEFDQASIEERIQFVQDLWDRIAANADELPIPETPSNHRGTAAGIAHQS